MPYRIWPFLLSVPLWLGVPVAMAASGTNYSPVTVENCGQMLSFDHAPNRIVTLGQNSAELVLALGGGAHLIASGVWLDPVPDDLQAAASQIPVLAGRHPSLETVLARQPDLVAAQFVADIGPQGRTGRREQFTQAGVATYISPTDCKQKMWAASNIDGKRQEAFDIGVLYQEIRELAAIMGTPERGERLIAALQERLQLATQQQFAQDRRAPSVMYWFSSAQLEGDAWVAGGRGAPAWINKTLGVRNVFDSTEEWPAISWERIAAADPDIIVIGAMTRRHFTADDVDAKKRFLAQDPIASQLKAVKEGHIVVMPAKAMNPSLDMVTGVELLAQALRSFGWQQ